MGSELNLQHVGMQMYASCHVSDPSLWASGGQFCILVLTGLYIYLYIKKWFTYLPPISTVASLKAFGARNILKPNAVCSENLLMTCHMNYFCWDLFLYFLLRLFYCTQNWRFIWVERGRRTLFWQLERYLDSHLCFCASRIVSRTETSALNILTFFFLISGLKYQFIVF